MEINAALYYQANVAKATACSLASTNRGLSCHCNLQLFYTMELHLCPWAQLSLYVSGSGGGGAGTGLVGFCFEVAAVHPSHPVNNMYGLREEGG